MPLVGKYSCFQLGNGVMTGSLTVPDYQHVTYLQHKTQSVSRRYVPNRLTLLVCIADVDVVLTNICL